MIARAAATPSESRLISGLKTATAIHMLRSVFGKTPGFCSSMKLAELSKPLMPSMAAAKPKKSACTKPAGRRRLPVLERTAEDRWAKRDHADAASSTTSVSMWETKITERDDRRLA